MSKFIRMIFKTDKFQLCECKDGYYLYDFVIGMNISMRAKTEQDAYIESLSWYQNRLQKSKAEYKTLNDKVDSFLCQFEKDED